MKKLFYLFMVAMCATMFLACSDDDDKDPLDDDGEGKEGVITMTTEKTYIHLYVATFNEGDIITIDWGDGDPEEFKSFKVYKDWDEDGVWGRSGSAGHRGRAGECTAQRNRERGILRG